MLYVNNSPYPILQLVQYVLGGITKYIPQFAIVLKHEVPSDVFPYPELQVWHTVPDVCTSQFATSGSIL